MHMLGNMLHTLPHLVLPDQAVPCACIDVIGKFAMVSQCGDFTHDFQLPKLLSEISCHSTLNFPGIKPLHKNSATKAGSPLKDMYTLIDDSCNCSYRPHCKALSFPEMHSQSLQSWGALALVLWIL